MRWPSFSAAIFDCDSTLSSIEGIDELASSLDKKEAITALTDAAMNGELELDEVYKERLELLRPTKQQVLGLKNAYKSSVVPYARELVALLKEEVVDSWIVSGGLFEPVKEYGIWLGFDEEKVRAVGSTYDPLVGQWWKPTSNSEELYLQYEKGDLTSSSGKGAVIRQAVTGKGRKLMLGDGASDLAVKEYVDLFVAYAGVVERPAVVENASVVVQSESLASVAALVLGPARILALCAGNHAAIAEACLSDIQQGSLRFNDASAENRFMSSFKKVWRSR